MFIRLIGEYNVVEYYGPYLGRRVRQKTFSVDPPVNFELNAFSVFYLDARIVANNNVFLIRQDVRLNDQTAYVK